MERFDDLFRDLRSQDALFGSSSVQAPWSLHFVDGAPLTLAAVTAGAGWIIADGADPERIVAGELVVVRGPSTFHFVDDPATDATPVECGADCAAPELGGTTHRLGWHDVTADGATTLVAGSTSLIGDVGTWLQQAVPPVLRVDADDVAAQVLDLLVAEVAVDAPGQQVVLDRLLDWMLLCAIREYLDRPDTPTPAWYAAHRDSVVGPALRALHADLAAPWTVASLAAESRTSRATLAKRFASLVGEPPLTYLTTRRMAAAADLLVERREATLAEVARAVGYADAFGFSAAFKRCRGVSPTRHRRARLTSAHSRS